MFSALWKGVMEFKAFDLKWITRIQIINFQFISLDQMNYWFCNQSDIKVFDLKVNKNSMQL